MKPEERACENIDRRLEECRWRVQDRYDMSAYAARGIAVRVFSMPRVGDTDYLLYAEGKAIGLVEAKARGVDIQRRRAAVRLLHGDCRGGRGCRLREATLRTYPARL